MTDRESGLTTGDRWTSAQLAEIRRLASEVEARIAAGEHLPAIASIQGLVARANDVGEFCAAEFKDAIGAPSQEEVGAYL